MIIRRLNEDEAINGFYCGDSDLDDFIENEAMLEEPAADAEEKSADDAKEESVASEDKNEGAEDDGAEETTEA